MEQTEMNFEDQLKDMYYLTSTPQEMVTEFPVTYGLAQDEDWKNLGNLDNFRYELVEEEFFEVQEACEPKDKLKELADLVYVCYGYAVTFGWDLDEALRRVHESNMSKLNEEGRPIYRRDGKVLKGPNYFEPNLEDLV